MKCPGQLAGTLLLSPKSFLFPPLHPNNPRCGGELQLFSVGDAGLGEPVAADNNLYILWRVILFTDVYSCIVLHN